MTLSNSTDRLNGLLAGLAVKAPCIAVSNVALTLSGEQTVNSVAVTAGDRVLVKDQTDASENGIFDVSTSAWQRSADFDGNRDVVDGTLIIVDEVGIYQVESTDDPVVIGTSDLTIDLKFAADALVTSVFGRIGDVVAAIADYSAFYSLLGHLHGQYLENVVEDLSPQLGGDLDANSNDIAMGDREINRPRVTDYGITHQALGTTGAVTMNYSLGQSASIALSGNVTLAITNPPATGIYGEIQILIVQDSVARTITWPASFNWPAGTAPDLTTVSSVHVIHAFTVDAGANWYATHAAEFS